MSVLIVTNKRDPHADEVLRIVESKGIDVFRFNTEDFCKTVSINLTSSNQDFAFELRTPRRSLRSADIRSILYRRPEKAEAEGSIDDDSRRFVEAERAACLSWLWRALDCFWVSRPDRIRVAESKFDQLRIAPRFGFSVPRTLVTNDPDEARKFCIEFQDGVINKVLSTGIVHRDGGLKAIYTRPVLPEHLPNLESIRCVPCVFQEYIPKALELRISIVGHQVFAAAIYSQMTERTKHDWRRYDLEKTPHAVYILPAGVERACIDIVQHYGLAFAAIDMVVTPQGDFVFLELNPNGQWLWIERLTGQPISDAIADMLVRAAA